jgi:hypothetical protein
MEALVALRLNWTRPAVLMVSRALMMDMLPGLGQRQRAGCHLEGTQVDNRACAGRLNTLCGWILHRKDCLLKWQLHIS